VDEYPAAVPQESLATPEAATRLVSPARPGGVIEESWGSAAAD
jgi:hypothetical protein